MDVTQQSAVVSGQFHTDATYKVWLKVYEGQLTFPSKIVQPLEASATTENKGTTPYVKLVNVLIFNIIVINTKKVHMTLVLNNNCIISGKTPVVVHIMSTMCINILLY